MKRGQLMLMEDWKNYLSYPELPLSLTTSLSTIKRLPSLIQRLEYSMRLQRGDLQVPPEITTVKSPIYETPAS